jgi:hypothetical protein
MKPGFAQRNKIFLTLVLDEMQQIHAAFWGSDWGLFLSLWQPVSDPPAMFRFVCRLARQTVSNSWHRSWDLLGNLMKWGKNCSSNACRIALSIVPGPWISWSSGGGSKNCKTLLMQVARNCWVSDRTFSKNVVDFGVNFNCCKILLVETQHERFKIHFDL